MTWDNFTLVLAQEAESGRPGAPDNTSQTSNAETTGADGSQTPVDPAANPDNTQQSPFGGMFIWLLLPVMLILMFSMGGGRKEKKKHAAMMAALAKGDRIRTTGGILGTVLEVRDDEIVVKVDESNNTKMRFVRAAIATVVESKHAE